MTDNTPPESDRERDRQRALRELRGWSGEDYVWDGVDEDDRPLTEDEMREGIEAADRLQLPKRFNVTKP